jgi:O-acetyl-ADP-ribose deacetylase (regulator of RNase III)
MIHYTHGNLLEAKTAALVNTVNTVGVMGKGIALMFKERFIENFRLYAAACKNNEVRVGRMFVTHPNELDGPTWIINFPTKQHWRAPSTMEWIVEGLKDLRSFIVENQVRSIAVPPLGAGNGGLNWADVKVHIEQILGDLSEVDIQVFEPSNEYQNVAKRSGVEKLTPARALIAELVRRYEVLGMECTLLEVQKLAWLLERALERFSEDNPLDLRFEANRYGPYADRLRHLLNGLDGSYLHCDKRIGDAGPLDAVRFEDARKDYLRTYLNSSEARPYQAALEFVARQIDGFESPFGMELLATIDWLLAKGISQPRIDSVKCGLEQWPSIAKEAAGRKARLFDERNIGIALERLMHPPTIQPGTAMNQAVDS